MYYLTQPADTTDFPPSPLATVYSSTGGAAGMNPQQTDGYGHAVAYLNDGQLYTLAFYHPLLGPGPLVLADQSLNGASSGGVTPFAYNVSSQITGTNNTFTLPVSPATLVLVQWNSALLVAGVGFTTAIVDGVFTITLSITPKVGQTVNVFGLL